MLVFYRAPKDFYNNNNKNELGVYCVPESKVPKIQGDEQLI